ncbi:MAG: purine nucleoside permease [Cyanobacteria bacterium P01_F01_bin.86]
MKKTLVTTTLTMAALITGLDAIQAPAWSQTDVGNVGAANVNLGRARNIARQAIESLNGGLQEYRAEPAMHGPACLAPFTENGDGSLTFTFFGGTPGASFSIESVVTVMEDGTADVVYNGPIRPNAQTDRSTPNTLSDDPILEACLTRTTLIGAKNTARQAAEVENGGLSQYRAEPAMHSSAADAPFVENEDGSLTFTFKGRRPESLEYTIESVVTVSTTGEATIEYNGPVR